MQGSLISRKTPLRTVVALAMIVGYMALYASPAMAAGLVFEVDKETDSANTVSCTPAPDDCSLREAIINANTAPGADAVEVPEGTYTLSLAGSGEDASQTGDLDVTDELTITGAGARETIIDAGGIDRVLENVTEGTNIEITGVTITGGNVTETAFADRLGGGIDNHGDLELSKSAVRNNTTTGSFTAGIHSGFGDGSSASTASLTVIDSTVSGNSNNGNNLGGIFLTGSGTTGRIENSTISTNSASSCCGGVTSNSGNTLEILDSTITNNTATFGGSGLSVFSGSTATVKNSIVALNGGGGRDCNNSAFGAGTIISQGNNIDGDDSCGFTQPTDKPNTDPLLGPLANNGGPTDTHALLSGSPAIDAGDTALTRDQRGFVRPADGDGNGSAADDAGSFEKDARQLVAGALSFDSITYTVNEVDGSATITVTRTGGADGEVSVDYQTSDGTAQSGSDYMMSNGKLIFADGDTSKTFTVPITNDATDEEDETVNLALSNPEGGATLGEPDEATLTITDNDTAGITVNPISGLTTTEAGGTDTFTVVLNSKPTSDVTIPLTSSDTTEGTVSPSSLTFTPGNYDTPQSVTLTGVDDNTDDGDVAYEAITEPATSTDPNYSQRLA